MSVHLSAIGNAFQFFNTNGRPLNAGKLYTYAAGTSTPQTTYTDSGGGSANTNPIILNSDGRLPNEVWLTDATAYKFVLQTSAGSTIGTYDNITGINDVSSILAALASTTPPTGASLVGFKQPLTGASGRTAQTKLQEWVSLEDFGAVGNGVTDDTAAFLSFQTYAIALPAGYTAVLNCQPGKIYMCSNPYWPCNIKGLIVNGNGCIFKNNATVNVDKALIIPALGTDKDGLGTFYSPVSSYFVNSTAPGNTTVTTTTAADAGNFTAGEYLMVASFDQQFGGQPPNYRYFEYAKVTGVNAGTGAITLDRRLRYAHLSNFPYIVYANGDGRAKVYKIEQGSAFDIEHVYNDIEFRRNAVGSGGAVAEAAHMTGRRVIMNRCTAPYFLPTVCEHATLNDCIQTSTSEVDKLIDFMEFNGGTYFGGISSATSVNKLRATGTRFLGGYDWCPKDLQLVDCNVEGTPIRLKDAFGYTEALSIMGGCHESLPTTSIISTQTRSVTIGSANVTWATPTLTLGVMSGSAASQSFCAGCFVGQVVHVTQSSAGADLATGVLGVVTAITGSADTATIAINFNAALGATDQLTIFAQPHSVRIENVAISDLMTTQDWITFARKRYAQNRVLVTSAAALGFFCLGRLKRFKVDVLRAYSGATGGNITLAFQSAFPGGVGTRLNLSIDLKTTGWREATITGNAGFTGAAGESAGANLVSTSIAASLISQIFVTASTMAGTTDQLPLVSFELEFEDPIYRPTAPT